jgi:hypothetical protein
MQLSGIARTTERRKTHLDIPLGLINAPHDSMQLFCGPNSSLKQLLESLPGA